MQKPVLFISTFILLTIFISGNLLSGLFHLLKFFELTFLGYYVAQRSTTGGEVKKIILVLGIGIIGESLLAILQFFNQGSLNSVFYFLGERMFTASTPGIANASINGELLLRPYGTFSHPNVLAGFLLGVMALLFWTFQWLKNKKEKLYAVVCLLAGSAALFLTMSRVAILLWLGMLLLAFAKARLKQRRDRYLISLGFIVLFGVLLFSPFGSRLLATKLTEEAVVQRQELIAASLTIARQHPIVGVGFGNFLPALALVHKPLAVAVYFQPVHNIFLLLLAETGIVGLGIFLWFLVKTYRNALKHLQTHFPFVMLLTALLVIGLFDHYLLTLQQGQLMFALTLGLCWGKFFRD